MAFVHPVLQTRAKERDIGHFSLFLGNHEAINGKEDGQNHLKPFLSLEGRALDSCTLRSGAHQLHKEGIR